jgi:predicted  nucleic acid-binding Zn-ribbon protein
MGNDINLAELSENQRGKLPAPAPTNGAAVEPTPVQTPKQPPVVSNGVWKGVELTDQKPGLRTSRLTTLEAVVFGIELVNAKEKIISLMSSLKDVEKERDEERQKNKDASKKCQEEVAAARSQAKTDAESAAKAKLEAAEKAAKDAEAKAEVAERGHSKAKEQVQALEAQLQKQRTECTEDKEAETAALRAEVERLEGEIVGLRGANEALKTDKSHLEDELKDLLEYYKRAEEIIRRATSWR